MKFLYTNEKGGKIGHVTAYGPIAAVKIAKILKICCTVGCALIVLQHSNHKERPWIYLIDFQAA